MTPPLHHRPAIRTIVAIAAALQILACAARAGDRDPADFTRAALAAAPDPLAPNGELEFITVAPLLFEHEGDTLSEPNQRRLDDMAVYIRLVPGVTRVIIKGHSDRDAGNPADSDLSLRRAVAVRDYLVERGVAPRLIQATGYGSALPVDEDWTAEGRARNRRVEIYLIRKR